MAALLQRFSYRDAQGYTDTLSFYVPDSITGGGLWIVVTNCTNAKATTIHGPYSLVDQPFAYGTAATYQNIEDRAVMAFLAADGTRHVYQIPAPKSTLFKSDQQTVDPVDADVSAFTAYVIGNCLTKSGASFTHFAGGYRSRTKTRKRLSIYSIP